MTRTARTPRHNRGRLHAYVCMLAAIADLVVAAPSHAQLDPDIQVTKQGFRILDTQMGTVSELSPFAAQGVLPPPESSQVRYVSGLNTSMYAKYRTFAPTPSTPTLRNCDSMGFNPNQMPVQWEQYRTGQITLDQWNALNPGFGTTCWFCNSLPASYYTPQTAAFPTNGPQGCTALYWANPYQLCRWTPYWVYGPDDVNCWVGLWEHGFWANNNTITFVVDRPGLLSAHIGHGDHLDVHFADSLWWWTPCDLNGDGVHDQADLLHFDDTPYDWNGDGAVNALDRTELQECLATCYADCDGVGGLTANDFACFLNAYASNSPYANCDRSTGTPLLTANDFTCFINEYVTGCGN